MQQVADRPEQAAIRVDLGAIFVSMELSRSNWLITSLSPGGGEKMSKYAVRAGDVAGLLEQLETLKEKARARTGKRFRIIVIQEAGLDGFWIHRVLQSEGIESHVVDAASILVSRRRRRAKTDKIDGETLVRTLLAYKRGEPRVCSMVKPPTPEEEDCRRISRERKTLVAERVKHVNRIKGLLFAQGIGDYEPLRRDRRARLEALQTGDGRALPVHLKAQVVRELDRLKLIAKQLQQVEAARDELMVVDQATANGAAPAARLLQLKGVGAEFANVLWSEGLYRPFDNRRQLAAYAGLAPTPLAERLGRSRAGRLEDGQPTAENDHGADGLALVATPASLGPQPVVPSAGGAQRRTAAQDPDRPAGAQITGGALAIRDLPRGDRGRPLKARLICPAKQISFAI
jgi:transposase